MEKAEFQIDIDKQPVDELRESMDKLEGQVKELQKTNLGLEDWSWQFEKFKRELKGKADEIETLKARILSFNNWDDSRELDDLSARLNTTKNEYSLLAQEAANACLSMRSLSDLDVEANKSTSAISGLFEDMSKKSVASMRSIADRGAEALTFLKQGEWDAEKGTSLGMTEETFNTVKGSPEELEKIGKAVDGIREGAIQCDNAFNQMGAGLTKIFESKGNEKELAAGLDLLKTGFGKATQAGQFLSGTLSSLGKSFGNDTLSGVAEGLNVAMDAANAAMQGAQVGALFGPIGVAAGAAVGAVTSLASSFAKLHDAGNESRIQGMQGQIEALDKSYGELGDSVEIAYSKDVSGPIEQQNRLLEQQKALVQQQIAEEEGKKDSDAGRVKEWQSQMEGIDKTIMDNKKKAVDAIFGEDLKSAIENFAGAYADAWASGGNKAESAKDTVKAMMRQMVTESIKKAVKSSEAMERIREKLKEFYTDNVLSGSEQKHIYGMAEGLQGELDSRFGWADGLMGSSGSDGRAGNDQKQRLEKEKSLHSQLQDLRRQNRQEEINLMEEGSEKKKKQIELDYDREIATILAKEEEWKEAQGGKLTTEQTAGIHGALTNSYLKKEKATAQVDTDQAETEKKSRDEQQAAERQAMNEYLKEYGTYLQKREAITALYNDKIAKAKTEGERLSLGKELTRSLSGLDVEANKSTSAISGLFDDMSKKSVASMKSIADRGSDALSFLKKGEWDAETGAKLGMTEETFNTVKGSPEELEKIGKAVDGIREGAIQCDNAFGQMGAGLTKIFESKGNEKEMVAGLDLLQAGLGKATQAGQFLSGAMSSLGESFGNDTLSGIAQGLNVAMDAANAAMQGAQAGAMFGPMGAAAGAAVGAVTSLVSSFAKIHDAKNERRIQGLQDQIEVLDKSYGKLGDSIEKAYSKDASGLIDQQNKMLEQQKVLIQQQIAEEEDKKKSDDDRIKEWREQMEEIDKTITDNKARAVDSIFGEDLKSAIENFAGAYADAWASGGDKAQSAKDTVKAMMRQMVTESIKAAVESSGAMERIREKLKEFYADNVLSGWEQEYVYGMAEGLQRELDSQFGWADGLMRDGNENEPKDGVSGQLQAAMTEGTASQLVGLWNSTSLDMRELKLIGISAGETAGSILADVREIFRHQVMIEQNTRRGADNTNGLIGELQRGFNVLDIRLSGIERNTKTYNGRG